MFLLTSFTSTFQLLFSINLVQKWMNNTDERSFGHHIVTKLSFPTRPAKHYFTFNFRLLYKHHAGSIDFSREQFVEIAEKILQLIMNLRLLLV